MANAFFRKRIGPPAVPILAVASNLPDIDAVVVLSGDPAAILMRRTFGHSLFILPFWALILAFLFQRRYREIPFKDLYRLVLLGAGVHVFFDLVNSFGVVPLWPFSDWRPELGIIFIIDLILTGLLAAPLLLTRVPAWRRGIEGLSRIFVVCLLMYVLFCNFSKMVGKQLLTAETRQWGEAPAFSYLFPEPFGPFRWRGVAREGKVYHVYLITPLAERLEPKRQVQTEPDDPYVLRAAASPLGRRLLWFFKAPVWEVERESDSQGEKTALVRLYDLRFAPLLIDRANPFVFTFRVYDDGRVEPVED